MTQSVLRKLLLKKNDKLKILYLTFNDPYASLGVYKKELSFCNAIGKVCTELGIHFKGINIFAREHSNINSLEDSEYFELKEVNDSLHKIFSRVRLMRSFFRIRPVFKDTYEEIKRFSPNVIVSRYYILHLPALFNPKKVKKNILFISEHQSKEIEELRMGLLHFIFSRFERLKAKKFFRNVDAVVGVTSEIAKYEIERANRKIPYFILTNGIDVEKYKVKKFLKFKGDTLKMIFVGLTTNRWHGLDRLLIGMKNYNGNVKLELNVVGSTTKDIRNLVKLLHLEKEVEFHGHKYGKELDEIFDNSHIAISTLGIHRKNLKYGSTLKVREYMARGITFVISHIDEDIENSFPLYLKLSSNDNPINMYDLIEFTREIYITYGISISSVMRNYALKKMDYKVKANDFLDFILNLLK